MDQKERPGPSKPEIGTDPGRTSPRPRFRPRSRRQPRLKPRRLGQNPTSSSSWATISAQFKVGFMSNNPPVYDVIPIGEMGIKAWLEKHGFGRFQP